MSRDEDTSMLAGTDSARAFSRAGGPCVCSHMAAQGVKLCHHCPCRVEEARTLAAKKASHRGVEVVLCHYSSVEALLGEGHPSSWRPGDTCHLPLLLVCEHSTAGCSVTGSHI